MKRKLGAFFALFTSTGTLFCCALPAAIAAVAGGAAVGTFVSAFPWVIPLSRYKGWLFLLAGALIVLNGFFILRPKEQVVCAVTGGDGCEVVSGFTKFMFWSATGVYVVGAFFAYAAVPILQLLEG